MALAFFWNLQNLWPFSALKFNELRASNELVAKLHIPEQSKQFVFAIWEPETRSVIYILSAQNLSERSTMDVEFLIREIGPDAVVAQVGHSAVNEFECVENELTDKGDDPVPTSSFGVLKQCFVHKINKEKYESVAGSAVLREIFGVSFHGHILAAKRVAKEVGSSFLVVESPFVKSIAGDGPSDRSDLGNMFQGLVNNLVPQKVGSVALSSSNRFCLANDAQLRMIKLLSSYMDASVLKLNPTSSVPEMQSKEINPRHGYEAPPFALSIYPLLVDLHDIFADLPSIGSALVHAQKMFLDVNRGEVVDTQVISEVVTFRIAVEALRIALNSAGRLPITKTDAKTEFSDLPVEEKSHVLFAKALRSQMKKFKTIVAVIDASSLAGLRKHWNTPVPSDVNDLVEQLVTPCEGDGEISYHMNRKRSLTDKPMVAVGAGATAVLGISSLSKGVPASTIVKVVTFKVPASFKLIFTQAQKAMAIALSKTIGPSKVVVPGFVSSGAKSTTVFKATASAEKIRLVAHSVIASAEKTSFSAMRTAFYEIMRTRRARPVRFVPWATFGCSIATCTGLLMYGNGIECVAESLPAAPSIASLGRGIQNLHVASQSVRHTDDIRIQKSIEFLMCRLKRAKVQ